MATPLLSGVMAMFIVAQAVQAQSCKPTVPDPAQPADGFVTRDGVRFRVEVVATNLEIPWSMAFGPDGRLFVTERPGRVRILDPGARTNELALILDDVAAQGEAGLLGLALDPAFAQ